MALLHVFWARADMNISGLSVFMNVFINAKRAAKPPVSFRIITVFALVAALLLLPLTGYVQSGHTPQPKAEEMLVPGLIRDAEIEQLLRDYVSPIFKAAGVNAGATQVILVGDRSFNAFVANGRKIYINVGTIIDAKTPNEVIGVLAHETGHITGGHLALMHQQLAQAEVLSVIGMLASIGAVAASASHSSRVGMDNAGVAGIVLGPQEAIQRSLLAYARGEEEYADRAAIKFLDATGQSGNGLLKTMQRLANDSLFISSRIDPYLQTHPLPTERLAALTTVARQSLYFDRNDSPALQLRHDLARAKLIGFVGNVGEVQRRYPLSDTSLPARYARAIAAYRDGRLDQALPLIDTLIQSAPQNPYFHELKGQALLEGARPGEALAPLRRAVSLAPNAWPIHVLLGRALVATENGTLLNEAIAQLTNAVQHEREISDAYDFLSIAYGKKGDETRAELVAAQGKFYAGQYIEARTLATKVQAQRPVGSPDWIAAGDILNYRPSKKDE